MSGYNTVIRIRRLEETISELGFMLCHPKHYGYNNEYGELVAIKPKDEDALPIYSRDAELFSGTLEELEVWVRGVVWARNYDKMLRLSDEKKRSRKEQDALNQRTMSILSNKKVEEKG